MPHRRRLSQSTELRIASLMLALGAVLGASFVLNHDSSIEAQRQLAGLLVFGAVVQALGAIIWCATLRQIGLVIVGIVAMALGLSLLEWGKPGASMFAVAFSLLAICTLGREVYRKARAKRALF